MVVPLLSLVLGLSVHEAIASSLVSIVGTACSSAAVYVKAHFTNIRLGILLGVVTAVGALGGAFLATWLNARWLFGLFAVAMALAGYFMLRRKSLEEGAWVANTGKSEGITDTLTASYHDPSIGGEVHYRVSKAKNGLGMSTLAGTLSGLLGIGGGVVNVPVMNLVMGLPIKAAIGTSQFMISITASAGAFVFYQRGYVEPLIVAPVLIGALLGAQVGAQVMRRTPGYRIRMTFSGVLFVGAVVMSLRAAGVEV